MLQKFMTFFLFLSLTSCAIGPLVSHETARTVGRNKHEPAFGYGMAGYVLKWNYGITDNFDIGLHWESLSIGLRAKYAFIKNDGEGFSLASAIGYGSSIGGKYTSVDLLGSYLVGQWEPFSMFRYVHVKTDPIEFRSDDPNTQGFDFTISSQKYDYGQLSFGSRYWFKENLYFSGELSYLFSFKTEYFDLSRNLYAGGIVGVRF